MSYSDRTKQYEFATWLECSGQGDTEESVRHIANKFMEAGSDRVQFALSPPTSSFPPGPLAHSIFRSVSIDIDPAIQGFPRRLIAEAIVREAFESEGEPEPAFI